MIYVMEGIRLESQALENPGTLDKYTPDDGDLNRLVFVTAHNRVACRTAGFVAVFVVQRRLKDSQRSSPK